VALKGGYWGKVLWVDLSNEKTSVGTFDETFARNYLGGVGFAVRLIYENVTKHTDPLGPGNVLVFATGPYQASIIAGSGRCSASAKSPLTGYWGESIGGATIGHELKRTGFDAVVITGRAKMPVYLRISDGKAEIRDGSGFWGLDTADTVDALTKAVGDAKASVTSIGPAGENLVKYACIATGKYGYFGRCGLEAVMGSKNLKALVVRGTLRPPIADPDKFNEVYKVVRKKVREAEYTEENRKHGQAGDFMRCHDEGVLPMKNWAQDWWSGASKIAPPRFTEELQMKPWSCAYCVMGGIGRLPTQPTNPRRLAQSMKPWPCLAQISY